MSMQVGNTQHSSSRLGRTEEGMGTSHTSNYWRHRIGGAADVMRTGSLRCGGAPSNMSGNDPELYRTCVRRPPKYNVG